MTQAFVPDPEELLAHAAFVRAAARGVLGGDAEVEDVIQDTWLAALGRGPKAEGALRAWLSSIARHRALDVLRRRGTRRRREAEAARPDSLPSVEEIATREEARQRLVAAVLHLEEPSRTAVLLRYYHDLPVGEVAARLGVPVETAKTRIHRGLVRLRERFDAERGGDRHAWAIGLVPLASPPHLPPLVPVAGALAMKKVLAAAALLLLVGGGGWLAFRPSSESKPPRSPSDVDAATSADVRGGATLAAQPKGPDPVAAPVAAMDAVPAAGRVLGTLVAAGTHEPLAGLNLVLEGAAGTEPVKVATDANGRIVSDAALPAGELLVEVDDVRGLVSFSVGRLTLGRLRVEAGVVVASRFEYPWAGVLVGRVADRLGAPIRGAQISAWTPAARSAGGASDGGPASPGDRSTTTDAEGRYRLERLPTDRDLLLFVRAAGFAVDWTPLTKAAVEGAVLDVVLARPGRIRGRVDPSTAVESGTNPAAYAFLETEWAPPRGLTAVAEADGTFLLEGLKPGSYRVPVQAGNRSLGTASGVRVAEGETVEATVHVPSPATSIRGVVKLLDGSALDPAVVRARCYPLYVWVEALEPSSQTIVSPRFADKEGRFEIPLPGKGTYRLTVAAGFGEGVGGVVVEAGGHDVEIRIAMPEARLAVHAVDGATGQAIEDARIVFGAGKPSAAGWPPTVSHRTYGATGPTGEGIGPFAQPGTYTVVVGAPGHAPVRSLLVVDASDRGSKVLEARLPAGRRIRGRVVDLGGRPIEGVKVAPLLMRDVWLESAAVTTDKDGAFALDALPAEGGQVGVIVGTGPEEVIEPYDVTGDDLVIRRPVRR